MKLTIFSSEQIQSGGGFQQALNSILLFKKHEGDDLSVDVVTSVGENISFFRKYGIAATHFELTRAQKLILKLTSGHMLIHSLMTQAGVCNPLDKYFARNGTDLVWFVDPSNYAAYLESQNYVFTLWDLCHRDHPEFPEIRNNREFDKKEVVYRSVLPKAVNVVVDSEHGKGNVVSRYGVDAERISIVPFSAAQGVRETSSEAGINIKQKYGIEGDYIYYPAQFWAHKNHIYILEALALLRANHGLELTAIFSGSDKGNGDHVVEMARKLGIERQIKCIGFVDNEEVPALYRQSMALVMPTYFGPTNIPPLEAFSLGVPVVYSDLPGLRDQVGDAALLMDLSDPASLVSHLVALRADPGVSAQLVARGKELMANNTDDQRWAVIESILNSYKRKSACW